MTFLEIFQIVSPFLSIAAIIIFTLAYVWTQAKNGSSKATQDTENLNAQNLAAYKVRIEQLEHDRDEQKLRFEAEQKSNHEKINAMAQEIGKLQGELKAKDEQIKILQGRNPEIEETLKRLANQMVANEGISAAALQYMEKSGQVFAEIKNFMAELHQESKASKAILDKQEKRHKKK